MLQTKLTSVYASVNSETKGLEIILNRVEEMHLLAARVELEPLLLDLLHSCCRLRVNRRAALALGAIDILLARICDALQQDPLPMAAEPMLRIVELLVEEANSEEERDEAPTKGAGVVTRSDLLLPSQLSPLGAEPIQVSNNVRGEQLAALLQRVGAAAVRAHPQIVELLAHVLPFLTYGRKPLMDTLVDHFLPHLTLLLRPAESGGEAKLEDAESQEREAHIHCFVSVVQRMGQEATAQQMREMLTQRGVVGSLAAVLADTLPGEDTEKDSPKWTEALAVPSLPRLLQVMIGR